MSLESAEFLMGALHICMLFSSGPRVPRNASLSNEAIKVLSIYVSAENVLDKAA